MKRILIVVLALCLGACASHPQKADTAEQVVVKSNNSSLAATSQNNRPSRKVFKDDYARLLVQVSLTKKQPVVLGRKTANTKSD